jgi:pyrimidine deaminase RibD-like protein/biotin carboxyl carrier protein
MNFHDLDNYNLADAVKFHQRLNPRLWGSDEHLLPDVRDKLLAIASNFQEFLGVDDLNIQDITISGSNAAYSYTRHSDIDLHLVVDMPDDPVYQELFNAKKYQYNAEHDIKIAGVPVELYVQPSDQKHVSQGIYSVKNGDWVQVPQRRRASIDDSCVQHKTADLDARIHSAIKSGNADAVNQLWDKIKTMRQTGLEKNGEFGCENITFKLLRNMGCIGQLKDAKTAIQDRELSLNPKPAARKKVNYGMRDYWYPGTAYAGQDHPAGTESEQVDESVELDHLKKILQRFYASCVDKLELENPPRLRLETTPDWSQENGSFGQYDSDTNTLILATAGRHVLDILRTMAHEMTHRQQDERNPLPIDAGETGSPWEDQANAMAGRIMRQWAEEQPEMFDGVTLEEASGYIPTKAQARDPRFVMALTRDVRPGAVGKEANKLGLKTNSQGKPALLMKTKNTLAESLASELALFKEDLFEVKMTSKNLANLAKDIKGARVGLEFEMIVPNLNNDEDDEQEPDYDQDRRVRDIDDAVNFFDDGDYNSFTEISRLRRQMESDYFDWQTEQIDQDWNNDGFEFFQEYLNNEEPFDPEDYQERAEEEIKTEFPDLDPTSEDFEKLVAEKLLEIKTEYYTESWEAQGRSYDRAFDEFSDERRDEYSENAWLADLGIRFASDVQNEYSDVQWPYWTSTSDGEVDIPTVALDFMNAIGMKSVAYSEKYHGSYYKWINDNWVNIGKKKPDDCFTVEPDGSLVGDTPGDRGLEFVSHPIPLEDIGTVMSKVQNWAGIYGAYTGKDNKTSIHTNISVPGYDLDKLDYLKAALLLGDEYVLREFDRFGNTYAAPAIEKVKQLVKQKPEKAKELLDKMKSQLNAKASKLIHSGQTDKFTSINTNDNRIEFRSPGGDYLSIIADNPQKMIDTINRMVVTMDAAMDPSKYKEEYQKKLYDMLTGQEFGRNPETGEIEWNIDAKASVWYKDERTVKGKEVFTPKQRPAFSTTVTASTADAAWKKAQEQNPNELSGAKKSDYFIEPKRKSQSNNEDLLKIFSQYSAGKLPESALRSFVKRAQLKRKLAKDPTSGEKYWWRVGRPGYGGSVEVVATNPTEAIAAGKKEIPEWDYATDLTATPIRAYDKGPVLGRIGEPQPLGQQGSTTTGNWGVWVPTLDRWVTVGNSGPRRFENRAGANAWIQDYNARHAGNDLDLVAQEIDPVAPAVNRNTLAPTGPGPWEVFRRSDGSSVAELGTTNRMAAEVEARGVIDQRREAPELYGVRTQQQADAAQGGIIDIEPDVAQNFAPQTLTRPGQGQQTFTGNWLILDPDGQEIHRFSGVGNVQSDANRVAINWMRSNPGRMQAGVTVVPEMGVAASQQRYPYTSTPIPGVEEVELDIPLAQTQWEVYNRSSNQPVFVIQAANQTEAWRKGQEWVAAAMQANPEVDASNFSVRPRSQSVSENITVLEQRLRRDLDESREITKLGKLDNVLEKCINMIHRGHETDPEKYGRVAACLIDNKNNHTYAINLPGPDGTRRHAERVAIDKHLKRHGRIGPNAIMITTLSPCVHDMDERYGESCTDLLADFGIEKCYAGWQDPTQHPSTDYPFNLQVTDNTDIFNSCRDIAASFLPGAMVESNTNSPETVTRIDSQQIKDFGSDLKNYKHTDDWSQSGIDTGDDSYWQKKNLKTNTTKGLFAGDPHRTALYATGNAHETRYVEFTQNGQPVVYFDQKDLPKMRGRKTYLTVFDAANFKKLPTGEYFSENPGTPLEQTSITDPFQYIADQGWIVRVTDDLNKVFKQVQSMHKNGKIQYYGAEGMNESMQQGVVEGLDEAVTDNYLYHATQPGGMMRILRSGEIKASYRPQEATKAKTQYPTVSTTRSKQYAESDDFVDFLHLTNEGNSVIIIFDKSKIANHYKMFSTSQGTQTVGDEFEEVIVVPKGSMPIQGTMKGFYFNPNRKAEIEEFKDLPWFNELLNSPYYIGQKQGVAKDAEQERPAMRFNEFQLTENSKVTIKRVQQMLLDLGYELGPTGVDGIVGPYTQSAIDAYMSKAGPQGQVAPKKAGPQVQVPPKKDKPQVQVPPKKDKPSISSTMPVNGRLTSAFGNRRAPVPGATTNHPGVDIAVPTGTPVRSPIAGKVVYASMDDNACGGTIAISNGGEKHRFCHCSKIDVRVGQVIQQGDVVGLTGGGARDPGRGLSTGPHLHWEKYIAGNLVDPMSNIG